MGANISVIGLNDGMGGLKESLSKFRKHHSEVGDALMNISGVGTKDGNPVDKDEARAPYEHQDFPRMLYHAEGMEELAQDLAGQRALVERGFRLVPFTKPQVQVNDPATEKKELLDRNRALAGELTLQREELARMKEQLAELTKSRSK